MKLAEIETSIKAAFVQLNYNGRQLEEVAKSNTGAVKPSRIYFSKEFTPAQSPNYLWAVKGISLFFIHDNNRQGAKGSLDVAMYTVTKNPIKRVVLGAL